MIQMKSGALSIFYLGLLLAHPLRSFADVDSGGDFAAVENDIGTIGVAEEAPAPEAGFRADVRAKMDYRTNAGFQGATGSADVLWLPAVEVGYNLPLSHGFSLDVSARIDGAFYSQYDVNNFMAYGGTAFLDWRHRPAYPRLYVGVEPYYFQGFNGGGLIQEAIGVRTGFDHGIPFYHGRMLFFYGVEYAAFFANPNLNTRNRLDATAGLMYQITPSLFVQGFYSYQFNNYWVMDRNDSRSVASLSLIYRFTPQLSGAIQGDYVNNGSVLSDFSYQSSGVGVLFAYQF
jgi:hypothetical protein